MAWRRIIILAWIMLTLGTIGLYARGLTGLTYLSLGPVGVQLDYSILMELTGGSRSFGYEYYDWEEFHGYGTTATEGTVHWDTFSFGEFHADVAGINSEVSFPLWFPFLILSAALWPLYSRAREQEGKLRGEAPDGPPD